MKKSNINYFLRIDGERYQTKSIRRFLRHTRTIKWEKHPSVYLRVSYGDGKDVFGKIVTFYNDGDYKEKKAFELALGAFLE